MLGRASDFIGDVPSKNIEEMRSFKLSDEDKRELKCEEGRCGGYYFGYWMDGFYQYMDEKTNETMLYKPQFRVCASRDHFRKETEISGDGYTLNIPDPIVLQPVNGGYLIITKWGLEGEDELLVNEKMN